MKLFKIASALTLATMLVSCAGMDIPIQFGLSYEIEPGLTLTLDKGAKGGLEVMLEGDGRMISSPESVQIQSESTGNTYEVVPDKEGQPHLIVPAI